MSRIRSNTLEILLHVQDQLREGELKPETAVDVMLAVNEAAMSEGPAEDYLFRDELIAIAERLKPTFRNCPRCLTVLATVIAIQQDAK